MLLDGDVPEHYRVWRREDGSPWRIGNSDACKATDLRSDEIVVLRFFDAPLEGPQDTAALAQLGQTLSLPHSPHVARLRDLFIRPRTHLSVAEFVEGTSLAARVAQAGPWPGERVQALAGTALAALAALHRVGIAHGNLGPTKLLFTAPEDTLKIVEFGLRPPAMALAPPAGNAATAADLRRLGITLWFALTGRLPFAQGLTAPPGMPPEWRQLDALPRSASSRLLIALFTRLLNQGEGSRRAQNAGTLLGALAAQGFGPVADMPLLVPDPAQGEERSAGRNDTAVSEPILVLPAAASLREEVPSASPPLQPKAASRGSRQVAGAVALLALIAGSFAARFIRLHPSIIADRRLGPAPSPTQAAVIPVNPSSPSPAAFTPTAPMPSAPPISPPVDAAGIQARAARIQRFQPATLEALKPARELRRVATLPVPDGATFPTANAVDRTRAALADFGVGTPQTHSGATLVLILGYSDEPETGDAASESQAEADALAGVLSHAGISLPIYACGLGDPEGLPEIDVQQAGGGGFVEVWVASFLF